MNLIDLAEEIGLEPNKISNRDGGEFHCACPSPECSADEDGFAIWPNSVAPKCVGRFWCRKCGVKGDALQFCMDFLDMTWREACATLNVDSGEFQSSYGLAVRKFEKTLKVAKEPSKAWQENATAFVNWCYGQLLKTPEAIKQVMDRGFTIESIKRYKIGYCPKVFWRKLKEWGLEDEAEREDASDEFRLHKGLIIPWFDANGNVIQIKVRRDTYEHELEEYNKRVNVGEKPKWKPQKYLYVKGGIHCPATFGDQSLGMGVLTESEFDGLLIQQEAGDLVFSIANGGSKKPIDLATDHLIRKTPLFFLCPDDDDGGDFLLNLLDTYQNMKLWPAPIGKSPGDALKYHGVNLRSWIIQGVSSVSNEIGERMDENNC